jgi:hypothetical protein
MRTLLNGGLTQNSLFALNWLAVVLVIVTRFTKHYLGKIQHEVSVTLVRNSHFIKQGFCAKKVHIQK